MSNVAEERSKRIDEMLKQNRKECENKTFRLTGVLNPVGVIPGFALPVFTCEQDQKWYMEEGDEDTLTINSFFSIESYKSKKNVVSLEDIKKNDITAPTLTIYSEPLFVFQISAEEYFIGYGEEMKAFLKDYKTEDVLLKEEIEDFMKCC